MAKIIICDLHKAEGQLVETIKFMRVPKHPELRMDLCEECMKKVGKMSMRDYVKLVYKTNMGIDLDNEKGMHDLVFSKLNIRD